MQGSLSGRSSVGFGRDVDGGLSAGIGGTASPLPPATAYALANIPNSVIPIDTATNAVGKPDPRRERQLRHRDHSGWQDVVRHRLRREPVDRRGDADRSHDRQDGLCRERRRRNDHADQPRDQPSRQDVLRWQHAQRDRHEPGSAPAAHAEGDEAARVPTRRFDRRAGEARPLCQAHLGDSVVQALHPADQRVRGDHPDRARRGHHKYLFKGQIGGATLGVGRYLITVTPTGGAPQSVSFQITS
jgi:hypothetical protein